MNNLESVICDIQEKIVEARLRRAQLDQALEALETRWRMLEASRPRPTATAVRIATLVRFAAGLWRGLPA